MKQPPMNKWIKWLFLITVAAAIIMALQSEEGDTAKPVKPGRQRVAMPADKAAGSGAAVEHVELERLAKLRAQLEAQADAGVGNVFGATSWYVPPPPPPPPPVPPPPPAPTAPPLPFTFLGRYEELIILVKGDRLYNVVVGDVIENTYRIEQVAAGMVYITYLPLNIKQTLNIGGA